MFNEKLTKRTPKHEDYHNLTDGMTLLLGCQKDEA